jgi:hypothetical protein
LNLWKKAQAKEIEIGGWKCPCCNPFGKRKKRHRDKTQLNKRTRRRIKEITIDEFKKE